MSWDDDIPDMVRTLIQDSGEGRIYRDSDITKMILFSGMQLQLKLKFANTYRINYANETLSPDPTTTAHLDNAFVVIAAYTTAVSLLKAEIRQMTRQGISIQDGDSKISLQRDSAALALMLKAYQDTLDKLIYDFNANGGQGFGEVIVTPYPYFSQGFGYGVGHDLRDRSWL